MADPRQPGSDDDDRPDRIEGSQERNEQGGPNSPESLGGQSGGTTGGSGGSGSGGSGSGGSGTGGTGTGGTGGTGTGGTGGSSGTGDNPENPLEALFAQLGLGKGALGDADMSFAQLGDIVQQLQGMLGSFGAGAAGRVRAGGPPEGGVNWEMTKDTARKITASLGPDPAPTGAQVERIVDAVSIAEVWLDSATDFPRVGTRPLVWSRADWVEQTMPTWRRLVEPVATHIADAMAETVKIDEAGAEAAGLGGVPGLGDLAGMMQPMLRMAGSSMFGMQLGQGLGRLSTEVVGATDIGLPLHDKVALLPTNIAAFGEGLDQTPTDVTLYLALRECARQRLFGAVGWLRSQLLTLVEVYARGITIDTSAMEQAVAEIDVSDLNRLSEALEGNLFAPAKTPEQQAVLQRLETMLALVEGWVDEVVAQATARWMPAADALAETMRRRRAAGGPAEETFAALVGLELRPRRLRDAANLWAAVRDARGADGRDAVWSHPDLAPTAADLDDPIGFVRGERRPAGAEASPQPDQETGLDPSAFDAELAKLLEAEARMDQVDEAVDADREDDSPGTSGDDPDTPDDRR